MADQPVKKLESFLENFLLWVLEGEKSPFNRTGPKSLDPPKKTVRKKRIKNKLPIHS